ncbi:glycosyltransferase family 2 protein [Candidatus Woesearchaeota archaeon]|jgi:GT2 family glycosyltransferase|nr:glycosyltransferase family 2 protein [Candidatus Woesearchaeota archaeon]
MNGVIITTHNRWVDCFACLNTVIKHTPDSYIILFDNESDESKQEEVKKLFPTVKYVRIDNQTENGGLTGTWNQGISLCLSSGCDSIVVLNHDTLVDSSWGDFFKAIKEYPLSVFGPVSNKPGVLGYAHPLQFTNKKKKYTVEKADTCINGFCIGFSAETIKKVKKETGMYFNISFPFSNNELEFCKRFLSLKGSLYVVTSCFVHHTKYSDWRKLK